jgi:hypothetical protein
MAGADVEAAECPTSFGTKEGKEGDNPDDPDGDPIIQSNDSDTNEAAKLPHRLGGSPTLPPLPPVHGRRIHPDSRCQLPPRQPHPAARLPEPGGEADWWRPRRLEAGQTEPESVRASAAS